MSREVYVSSGGVGLGTLAAGIISWTLNHSIAWLIVHAIFGWLYVIYALIEYSDRIP